MSKNHIKVIGVTSKIPRKLHDYSHNNINQTQVLRLSEERKEIKKIISIKIEIDNDKIEKFLRINSRKIILRTVKRIEVLYQSINNDMHIAKYNLPLEISIVLKNEKDNIKRIEVKATKVNVKMINSKAFYLMTNIFAVAIPEEKHLKTRTNIENTGKTKGRCNTNRKIKYVSYNYNYGTSGLLCLILIIILLSKIGINMF